MRWFLAFFFLESIWCETIDLDGIEDLPTPIVFVSLGSHCEPAVHLRHLGLRKAALPFDWLITNHEGLIAALDEDFRFFIDEGHLFQNPSALWMIENSSYHIEFRHDWPFPDFTMTPERCKIQLEEMKSKYTRRIERFRQLRNFGGKVIFIRVAQDVTYGGPTYWWHEGEERITGEQAIEIQDALSRFFPELDFTLAIVNFRYQIDQPKENCDRIRFFQIPSQGRSYEQFLYHLLNGN